MMMDTPTRIQTRMKRTLTDGQRLIAKAKRTALEDAYLASIRALGVPEPMREYRFAFPRRWRFDFLYLGQMLAIEIQGGTHLHGRRSHAGKEGYEEDCRKRNTAILLGWRVLTFTRDMVKSLEAAQVTKQALGL